MNRVVKNICLMALGGIAGAITGYMVAEIVNRVREEQEKQLEIEQPNEWIPEVSIEADPMILEQKVRERKTERREPIDYRQFSKDKGDLSVLVEQYIAPTKKVYIVSADEVSAAGSKPFQMIQYYDGDNTFCDIEEKMIDDPNTRFIPNVHLHFGEKSGDPDIVYIRNENDGVDYEITRIHNKYSVVVLGMVPPEPEKKKSKRSRRATTSVEKMEADDRKQESEE